MTRPGDSSARFAGIGNDMVRAARSMISPQGSASGDNPFLIVIPREAHRATEESPGRGWLRHPRERDARPDGAWRVTRLGDSSPRFAGLGMT